MLSPSPGDRYAFRETLRGEGELLRYLDGQEQRLSLSASGEAVRRWSVGEVDEQAFDALAVCPRGRLTLTAGGESYGDGRPWRGFALRCSRLAQVLRAEPVEREPVPELGPAPPGLPLDLDLSELFCLFELGLLPPRPLAVGERWSLDEQPGAAALPLKLSGRLAELSDTTAVLETSYEATIPERETPDPSLVARGTMRGRVTVWFDLAAGRVSRAEGPLELELVFAARGRSGTVAARMSWKLDVAAEPLDEQ